EIILNGGIKTLEDCRAALEQLDGVMIGREAYQNPYLLERVDADIFGDQQAPLQSRIDIATAYASYIEQQLSLGSRLNHMTRHILGLFNGMPGARQWRRYISENAHKPDAGIDVYWQSLTIINEARRLAQQRRE
ncbi:MAG: tRNA-dihydrouridine synthase, partial [Pseudomonadales bacterium]|nr:tRNA-dihydrouridine synthase [Pseudomonadales bacterium]